MKLSPYVFIIGLTVASAAWAETLPQNQTYYYPNNQIQETLEYFPGDRRTRTYYRPDGTLQKIRHYQDRLEHGEQVDYHPDGKTIALREFFDQTLQKVLWRETFYQNGQKKSYEKRDGNGSAEEMAYYDTGQLQSHSYTLS